jgi:hypothetical protein
LAESCASLATLEIIRLCPFSVATVLWGDHPTGHRLTISVKGTFVLTHRADATIAAHQDSVHGDISWDHNPQASLFAPSDFIPFKPRIDVIFSGRAFAPGGASVDALTARLQVGHLRKALRVSGPRVWMDGSSGLGPSVPERFLAAPLRYEMAAMQGENLSGIQQVGSNGWPLPRIEAIEENSGKQFTPGFGPLPIRWRAERHALTDAGVAFIRRMRSQHAVCPPNFPFSVFNCAPAEQQLDEIEPAPTIVLENLGRKTSRLESRLPMIRPRAFIKLPGSTSNEEIDMRLDTIFIDGVRTVAVLSWRGSLPVADPSNISLSKIVVAAESPEMMVSPEDIESPPFNYDDFNNKPVLPRPFEGDAPDDEGYTLLPNKPARQGSTDLPPRPQDSSIPIPPSGERPIEARASTLIVGGVLPRPNQIVERTSLGNVGGGHLGLGDAAQFSTAQDAWEPHTDWRTAADAAAGPTTPRTGAPIMYDAASDAPPPTARTGAASADVAPATQRGGPVTEAPGTPKTATAPPPATLPAHVIVAVKTERKAVDGAPATERAQATGSGEISANSPVAVSAPGGAKTMQVEAIRPLGDSRRSSAGPSVVAMPLAEIPLDVCAAVAARIDRRPNARAEILEEMGLPVSMFTAAERTWAAAVRAETEQGRSDLRAMYDRCYVGQLEMERGPLEIIDYVRLMIGVEHADLDEVLAEFDVPQASLVRIERVWRERMNTEPSLGARVRQAMAGARRAFSQSQRIPSLPES